MNSIRYERLSTENFGETSLDHFIRHQIARDIWLRIDGQWQLRTKEPPVVWDWDLQKRRSMAKTIFDGIRSNGFAFGAFDGNQVIGYIYISCNFLGSEKQYARLKLYHVSEAYRGKGIGRELFRLGCEEARKTGAEKLYISANNSFESQAAYRKLGCVYAAEVDPHCVEEEPFDVQMEYLL